jgi:hypothetical protein
VRMIGQAHFKSDLYVDLLEFIFRLELQLGFRSQAI